MKIKRVNKISIEMAPWEVERILTDIKGVVDNYQPGDFLYPLALHDFREELKGAIDGQA